MAPITVLIRPKLKATGRRVRVNELEAEYSSGTTAMRLLQKSDTDEMTIVDHLPIGNDGTVGKYSVIGRLPTGSTYIEE
jgi:hypothetical protein